MGNETSYTFSRKGKNGKPDRRKIQQCTIWKGRKTRTEVSESEKARAVTFLLLCYLLILLGWPWPSPLAAVQEGPASGAQQQQQRLHVNPHPLQNKSQVISLNWLGFSFLFQRAMMCVTCTLTHKTTSCILYILAQTSLSPCVILPDYLLPLWIKLYVALEQLLKATLLIY